MAKKTELKTWCEVTEPEYKKLFHLMHSRTTLTRGEGKWRVPSN